MKPLPLFLSAAMLTLAAGCTPGSEGEEAATVRAEVSQGTRVEVATIQLTEAGIGLDLTGEVEGARDARLASALGGYVESVKIDTGDRVRKGQLLVSVDRALYGAAYAQAEAQRDLAKTEFQRLVKMGDGVSDSQRAQSETQVKVAEAGLRQASVRLQRASIIAPFDGVVSAVAVNEGEVAGPGTPVARIVQLDPVHVIAQVSDRDVVSLEPGLDVSVTSAAVGDQLVGKVRQVSPIGDGNTRSFQVEVEVENPDQVLRPGMVTRVQIERSLGEAVVIPQDWIISKSGEHGVFVEVDSTARWQSVRLGRVLHNQVIIEEGLSPGARVITVGHRELLEGDAVLVAREGVCCTAGRVNYGAEEG